jgi:hypothetical protein
MKAVTPSSGRSVMKENLMDNNYFDSYSLSPDCCGTAYARAAVLIYKIFKFLKM